MLIDGLAIANDIKRVLRKEIEMLDKNPALAVFVMNQDLVTKKFIEIKKRFAVDVGVLIQEKELLNASTNTIVNEIKNAVKSCSGIIVQFPQRVGIDANSVRNAIPVTHDIDVLGDKAIELFRKMELPIIPPVVGAIKEILKSNKIKVEGKNVIIVGNGRLVGRPAAIWFENKGGNVTVLNRDTSNIKEFTKQADILVLGAGVPGLIKPDMIKEGVVLLDAGTSDLPVPGRPEEEGKLAGDADPACSLKASLFTPVPGGIGPITIAMIFKNLLLLKSLVK